MNLKLDINPHDICRICMSQTNNLLNYFKAIVKDGYRFVVPDMVFECLDIESDPNDGLPDKICDVCEKEITNFHLFKEKSARTEQILLTAFNKPHRSKVPKKPLTTTTSTTATQTEKANLLPTPITSTTATQTEKANLFACVECKMMFKAENLLLKHISLRHRSAGTDVSCQTEEKDPITDDCVPFDIDRIADDGPFEVPESIEIEYKKEMKLESVFGDLDDDVIDDEEMHVDTEDIFSEQKTEKPMEFEIELKSDHQYQCEDCLSSFTEIETWRSHNCPSKVIVQTTDKTFNAPESDELSEDYYDELILEDDMFECAQCHEKFTNAEDYTVHCDNDVHHYRCQQCDLSFTDQKSFKVHNTKNHEDHHCLICLKRFKTTTTFNQHRKLHESIEYVIDFVDCYNCDDCHKIFLLEGNLLQHECLKKKKTDESCTDYQYLEPDSVFFCEACPMEFSNLNMAKQHIIIHSKHFVCPFDGCGCSYEIWSRFAMHVGIKHLNRRTHQCRFCELEFPSFDLLQAHCKNNCPEKKYKCSHCEKSYFSQKALNLHIKDITKGKTFACTFCKKTFNRRGELDLHYRSHTNERPYLCTICGKAYKTSSMRAAHMDAHIDGKTFPCTLCEKKLQTRTSYRNHMKRHTEEKKHECEYCGKKFFTKFHVKLHASKIHKLKLKAEEEIVFENVAMDDYQIIGSY